MAAAVEKAFRILVPDIVFADLDRRAVCREYNVEILHQQAITI